MISVTPRARSREDRAGDPLDGLVNLFDLGIVLSVAFLLAALSSLHLGGTITRHGLRAHAGQDDRRPARPDRRAAAEARAADDRPRHPGRGRLPARQRPARVRPERRRPQQAALNELPLGPAAQRDPADRAPGTIHPRRLLWVTIRVAVVSTSVALVIGLPIGVALGLGRFRGRRALQMLANASLALPPVRRRDRRAAAASFRRARSARCAIAFTLSAVYIAQTILALPYIVALTPAAIQGLAARAARPGAGARRRAARSWRCSRCARRRSA